MESDRARAAELQQEYEEFLEPLGLYAVDEHLDVPETASVDDIEELFEAVLAVCPGTDRFTVVVGGKPMGTISRALYEVHRDPGGHRGVPPGTGDHGHPWSESREYVPLYFACRKPGCTHRTWRTHLDARNPPRCTEAEHGALTPEP